MDHTALNADWRIDSPAAFVADHVRFESPTHLVIEVDGEVLRISTPTSGRMRNFLERLQMAHHELLQRRVDEPQDVLARDDSIHAMRGVDVPAAMPRLSEEELRGTRTRFSTGIPEALRDRRGTSTSTTTRARGWTFSPSDEATEQVDYFADEDEPSR